MILSASSTVVVELTPPGRGAVAVIVVAGPEAAQAVGNCFVARSDKAIRDIPLGRIVLGRWGGTDGEEVVLCRRNEQQIEIHCHGGIAAVAAVIDRLVCHGCQRIGWQEWHSSHSPDPLRAAAQIALAHAITERTAAILLDQWNGALSAAVRGIASHIATAEWSAAAEMVDELLSRQDMGRHLTAPWRIVVVGAPNVGKSSLINALAGYERTIVSMMPGTTRDVVTVTTAIDGWPVQLSDTAGIRETRDELESAGIALATNALSRADLALFVQDAATLRDESSNAATIIKQADPASHMQALHVVNKIDLIPPSERQDLFDHLAASQPKISHSIPISALSGEGLTNLLSAIAHTLVPVPLPAGSAVPFTPEQIDWFSAAKLAIDERDAPAANSFLHALLTPASC
jgi:tRNA modification GTPase